MSNRVYLRYFRATLLDDDGEPKDTDATSYGFTVYDDYEDTTNWGYDTFKQLTEEVNLGNIINKLEELDNRDWSAGHFADEVRERGIYFNGSWYTAEYLLSIQKPGEDEDDECNSLTSM